MDGNSLCYCGGDNCFDACCEENQPKNTPKIIVDKASESEVAQLNNRDLKPTGNGKEH